MTSKRKSPEADWRENAACKGKTDVMFPVDGSLDQHRGVQPSGRVRMAYEDAKAICAGCPVVEECRAASIGENYGVWGGVTPRERAAVTSHPTTAVPRQLGPMRLPLEPLVDRFASLKAAARELGVDRRQLYRWREYGVTFDQADDLAGRLDLLPVEVWGNVVFEIHPDWERRARKRQANRAYYLRRVAS